MEIKRVSGIYKIVNKITNQYYIGSSKDILSSSGRKRQHLSMLRKTNM